ncbi:luciferase family protein [Streptomyces sp. NPDC004539]|uniref:luciferase domain-containing protein n=1 Tax=Streptomyces sp. NPDC004539 TaxID=3154280 RepID=UPI00339DE6B1
MTPAERAHERLASWPDLTTVTSSCGTGPALRSAHSEIVHFHSAHEVDLHLTGRAIQRLSRDLRASTAIRLLPGSRWVTVHLDCESDADLLVSLVSMALQAHQSAPPGEEGTRCNLHRVMLVPRDEPLV